MMKRILIHFRSQMDEKLRPQGVTTAQLQVLKAIRENEPRAVSLGYEINRYKLLAFVLSATLAGLAGTLALWLTDWFHHLSPAIPALIGAAVLLLPRIGVLTWQTFESKLSWGIILSIGAALSLGNTDAHAKFAADARIRSP